MTTAARRAAAVKITRRTIGAKGFNLLQERLRSKGRQIGLLPLEVFQVLSMTTHQETLILPISLWMKHF